MLARPIALVAALAACVIAGCGEDADGPAPSAAATASPPAIATSAAATAPAAAATWALETGSRRLVVVTVAADGSGLAAPAETLAGGDQTNPDWSPDGARLVFAMTDAEGHDDLWVTGADGTGARLLADCAGTCDDYDDPAWSPDGGAIASCRLATVGDGAHHGVLVAVDAATGAERTLWTPADPRDVCAGPRWSPDGEAIVLEVVRRDGVGLLSEPTGVTLTVLDVASGATTPLTDPALFAATADWSPAGDRIVFSALPAAGADAPDLFTIAPDGSGLERRTTLADAGGAASDPSFDRDGSIVFVAEGGSAPLERLVAGAAAAVPALGGSTAGSHPRPRPAPAA